MELAFLHTSKVRDRRRYKDYYYQITLTSSVSQNDQYLISTYEMIDVRKYLVCSCQQSLRSLFLCNLNCQICAFFVLVFKFFCLTLKT